MNKLDAATIGNFYLLANGVKYPISSLRVSLAMDEMPSAIVALGTGISVLYPDKTSSPEDLYVLCVKEKGVSGLYPCAIYEAASAQYPEDLLIFKGVISQASPVIRAGLPTSRMISFVVLSDIAALYVRPLASFVNTSGAALIDAYQNKTSADGVKNFIGSEQYYKLDQISSAAAAKTADLNESDPVAVNMAKIVNCVLQAAASRSVKENSDYAGIDISKYIQGNVTLAKDFHGGDYYKEIMNRLVNALLSVSVYDAIQQVLIGNEYMLHLLPRGRASGFKLELAQSADWDPSDPIQLDPSRIQRMEPTFDFLGSLNMPEVFMVNYSPFTSMGNDDVGSGTATGSTGMFAVDAAVDSAFKSARAGQSVFPVAYKDKVFKSFFYAAPKWLVPKLIRAADVKSSSEAEPSRTKAVADKKKLAAAKFDLTATNELADKLAKSLYVYLYGQQDSAEIPLMLDVRRTMALEESLGRTIEIMADAVNKDSPYNVRGILKAVSFSYSSGERASAEYSITLKCIRPMASDNTAVKCPLYK